MTNAIDISKLSKPDVIETLDFETILAAWLADYQARDPAYSATVESDPVHKLCQVGAYREMLVRQRVNDAALRVMLAFAKKTSLDHLGALYNVFRLEIDPGDPLAVPPVPATAESDEALLNRILLAPEGFSVAGPEGAYLFYALTADGNVKHVSAVSPTPGDIDITVLSNVGDGAPDAALLQSVTDALAQEAQVRPLSDNVTVQAASIATYTIEATIFTPPGVSYQLVLDEANALAQAYADNNHRISRDIYTNAVSAALFVENVRKVTLTEPSADILRTSSQAAYCTGITINWGGIDE